MTHPNQQTPKPGHVVIRIQGRSEDVAKVAEALAFVGSGRFSSERPDRDAPTVRRFVRANAARAEVLANATKQMRRKLALIRALHVTYPQVRGDVIRDVLDRDLTDDEITQSWGPEVLAGMRRFLIDPSKTAATEAPAAADQSAPTS